MTARLRRALRLLIAAVLYYSGLLDFWGWWRRNVLRKREVCVLGFHRVLKEEEFQQSRSLGGILLKETTFARMLDHLTTRFSILSLDEFLDGPAPRSDATNPSCLLTFDDGWRDNFETAYPLLRRFRVPATIFLVTGLIGSEQTFWVESLMEAWRDPQRREQIISSLASEARGRDFTQVENVVEYLKHMPSQQRDQLLLRALPGWKVSDKTLAVNQMMSWEQVLEMKGGGIDFGSHTHTHPLLPYEEDGLVKEELCRAKQILEEKLGVRIQAFAYPNGTWDERVRSWVEKTGYQCAFTVKRGWHRPGQDPYAIPRILLHEGNVTGLKGNFSPAMLSFTLARGR